MNLYCHQLTCFIHVKQNIKDKGVECNLQLPGVFIQCTQNDILGKKIGGTYFEGLVDVCSETVYNSKLDAVIESWQNALHFSTVNIQKFRDCFLSNKGVVLRDTMLHSNQQECGLGCRPEPFTTNSSESIDAVLKQK